MILKISNNNAVDFFIKEGGTPLEHQIFVYAFSTKFLILWINQIANQIL